MTFFETTKLVLFHQNIAGILNKQDTLSVTLNELKGEIGKIDIICLTETFIKKGSEKNLNLNGYKLAASFCRKKRRGGSCILLGHDLDYKIIEVEQAMLYLFECCAIELKQHKLIIVCIYRTPNSKIDTFMTQLQALISKLSRKHSKNIVLCGDWNVNMMQNNKNERELNSLLKKYNLINHINQPTRKNACLDLICSNLKDNYIARTHCVCLSDHETGQSLTFNVDIDSKHSKKRAFWFEFRRDMCKSNEKKFLDCISSLSFNDVLEKTEVEEAFCNCYDIIILFYNLCFPLIRVKITRKPLKNLWHTKGIKLCCVRKRQLYLKYRLAMANKKSSYKLYQSYSKILKKCIVQAQKNTNACYIMKAKNVCKTTWDILKKYIHHSDTIKDIKEIKINNNESITDPIKICEKFNKYFINLTNNNIDDQRDFSQILKKIPMHHKSIYLAPVDEYDVMKIIKNLKKTNSTGCDCIKTDI